MTTMKRKTISNDFWSEQRKKGITDRKSSIENCSSELFYEIFDYLDGWDLYQAFVNLNQHFQQLLHSPLLRLKIKLRHWRTDDPFENNWKQMIHLHRDQIFSMDLSIVSSTTDFSFNRLQSLTVRDLDFNVCVSVLHKSTSLPCLSSLTIAIISEIQYLNEIFRIILALPMLEYYKFSADDGYFNPSLPMATPEQFSSIEILVIDQSWSFKELASLVSYTPHLRQLHVTDSVVSSPKIKMVPPISLTNLTHLTVLADNLLFSDVKLLFKRMNFKLKMLFIRTSEDASYLHANRWEKLIVQYLPYLEEFSLLYQECISEKHQYDPYRGKPNAFLTPFWIQRQWFLDIDIEDDDISYFIQSRRKQWYDDFPKTSSLEESTELLLLYENEDRLKFVAIKRVLKIAQVYHLAITKEDISIEILIRTIELLPDLQTLTIESLSLDQSKPFSPEELHKFSRTKNTGKMTKVSLQQLNGVNDIDFLMALCPAITYLKVVYINNMTIAFYFRFMLKKIDRDGHRSLRSLSFSHPIANDQLVKGLEKMITNEHLLYNYSIKRVLNEIRLQWI